MNEMEIEYNDLLIISRETFKSGKSIVKINGKSILLSNVKKIANTLINIHGQHENQELLDSASHINYLDKFGDDRLNNVLKQYSEKYNQLLDIDKRIRQFKSQDEEKEKLTDFLKYQIEEINNARLKIGEDKKLEERYAILNNAEKINNALSNSYNILYNSNDTFISVYDCLNRVIRELKNVDKHMDKLKNITNSVEDTYFNIEQIISEIRNMQESIHYDKNELEYVNSRIFQIDS